MFQQLEILEYLHLFVFVAFFICLLLFEAMFPLRKKSWDTKTRWLQNWSFSLVNTALIRVLSFVTPLSAAIYVGEESWWLFNMFSLPFLFEILATIVILDFCIYLQHLSSHKLPWFWKLHQIHHSDESLDVSTALRFHSWEMLISMIYKVYLVMLFGFSPLWIIIFEIILVCSAIFNHANLKLPSAIEKYMSYIFVTPQFHQVHHSVKSKETDSNYWFFFSFWDRLCSTYNPHHFFVEKLGLNYTETDLGFLDLLLLKIRKK